MNKLFTVFGMTLGILVGLFTSLHDDAGVKIVMLCIGGFFGIALGGAIGQFREKKYLIGMQIDPLEGLGVTPDDIARNYWRDQIRAPMTSPLSVEQGCHQFDPDKI